MPTIYNKRGLSNALNAVNPVLGSGEIVYVMDTNTLVVGNGSGVFSSLSGINATPLTHSHVVSDITNFNTSVSGLLPTIANSGDNRVLTSTGSSVGINAESNLTFDGTLLNVSGSGTFASGVNISNQTGSTIASFDANKNVISLITSTYPSLTELSYVKGVTSALQTQIDGKSSTSHTHGNITSAGAIGSTANLPLITTTAGAITVGSFGSTANTFCQGNDSRLSDSRAPTGSAGGDLTGTYPNPTLTTTGVTGGTYRSVTVDTKGRITAGTNPTTLSGYGITDALQLSGGTLTGPMEISTGAINNNYNEGLRLTAANNGWTGITFGSTGLSGAPTNGWFAARNPSNQFIISPADSSSTTGITLNSGGNALWRNNIILHAGNYNSYAPTLTGGGASGSWGINITGNAATASNVNNGTLTLNVSGTGLSGSQTFTANQSGNATFTVTSNATSANTASTIVARDASGNFSAGTITATLSGNASTATSATTATGLNSSNYISRSGSSGNANTDFSNTPAGTVRHNGDDANLINGPGNVWWFYDNYRHSNGTNLWGTQIAWGWEDNANRLAQRNVTGGTWSAWVYYLNSGNYNSYAPSLTGGGASGTWGINVTGTAAGETLGTVTGRGTTTNSIVQSNASVRAPIFYDTDNTAFYCDPNGTSRFAGLVITGTDLYVGDGVTSSIIRMRDSDEGERQLHCNSNRIGFLNQSGGWGSWCEDDGSWATDFAVYAPIFYDRNNTAYYLDPASTSVLNRVNPVGWDTSGRNYSREWIEFPNHSALYSALNNAYFYPNNGSYGSWRIAGTRNGWAGLEFDSTGAGNVSLMMNSGQTGVHNNTYGWQWYWTGGKFYVSTATNGGGTMYPVVTSKIIGAALFGFESGTFYLDTYTGAVTSVSRVSQGVYQISYAAGTTAYFNVATSTILHSTYAFTTGRVTTYSAAHTVADARYITLLMFDSL